MYGFMFFFPFLNDFISLILEGKGERETSMCGCLSCPPTGDLAHNPGMCPDWESNQGPLAPQAGTQSTEPPARLSLGLKKKKKFIQD